MTGFNLLSALVQHAGQLLTREQLADLLRPAGACLVNAVNTHISNLKRTLWQAGGRQVLRTACNVGYAIYTIIPGRADIWSLLDQLKAASGEAVFQELWRLEGQPPLEQALFAAVALSMTPQEIRLSSNRA